MRAIITVLGSDRPGIIYHVSEILYNVNANIIDLDQTVLENKYFSMILVADISEMNCDYNSLKEKMDDLSIKTNLQIRVQQEDIFNAMYSI